MMNRIEKIDLLIAQLKELKKMEQKIEDIHKKVVEKGDMNPKVLDKVNADIMRRTYDKVNQERKIWHGMKEFEVSLEPEMFHLSCFHTYKLWTPNI